MLDFVRHINWSYYGVKFYIYIGGWFVIVVGGLIVIGALLGGWRPF